MQDDNTSVNALNVDAPVSEEVKTESEVKPDESTPHQETHEEKEAKLPEYARERLGTQRNRYEKQIAQMQRQIDALARSVPRQHETQMQPPGMQVEPGSVQEQVLQTLGMLAQQKRQSEDEEARAKVQDEIRQDAAKYDDFDDVVYDDGVPFTLPVAQATLELPNTADVQYYLGKNRNELIDLGRLPPFEMKKRLIKLSVDLMNKKVVPNVPKAPKPMEQLKSNPLTKSTSGITAKSTVSEIRQLLKNRK
jgi:hypothetical protein